MNIQPQQPISDDQELAKVLAGITAGADGTAPANLAGDLEEEASEQDKSSTPVVDISAPKTATDTANPVITSTGSTTATGGSAISMPAAPAMDSGLEAIKHDALNELRPLVDKLNLSADEKFDTYLLLIRSTDDTTLIAPAFEAARSITDETHKAQAMFDIVKEIDYLSNPQKPVI